MPRHLERSEYCRHQADECRSRATTTELPDVKEAYLQLELGWRQLVPDFDAGPNISQNVKNGEVDQPDHPGPPSQTQSGPVDAPNDFDGRLL
jgi:hypothetical protein